MTWKDKYDLVNMSTDGDIVIFGEHYSPKECKDLIEQEGYEEPKEYSDKVENIYIKFGIFTFDGEKGNGWLIYSTYKKGRIKATHIWTKKQILKNWTIEECIIWLILGLFTIFFSIGSIFYVFGITL